MLEVLRAASSANGQTISHAPAPDPGQAGPARRDRGAGEAPGRSGDARHRPAAGRGVDPGRPEPRRLHLAPGPAEPCRPGHGGAGRGGPDRGAADRADRARARRSRRGGLARDGRDDPAGPGHRADRNPRSLPRQPGGHRILLGPPGHTALRPPAPAAREPGPAGHRPPADPDGHVRGRADAGGARGRRLADRAPPPADPAEPAGAGAGAAGRAPADLGALVRAAQHARAAGHDAGLAGGILAQHLCGARRPASAPRGDQDDAAPAVAARRRGPAGPGRSTTTRCSEWRWRRSRRAARRRPCPG